jgi:hypothetical protein
VEEPALSKRSDEEIVEAIVVVVADCDTHAIHLDVETGFVRYVGEGSVMIVVVELGRGVLLDVTRPVHTIDQENIGPAVVIVVDEGGAWTERLGQEFLSEGSIVVNEANTGLLSDIAKRHRGGGWTAAASACQCSRNCERKRSA